MMPSVERGIGTWPAAMLVWDPVSRQGRTDITLFSY
jgi:hypothetical protein